MYDPGILNGVGFFQRLSSWQDSTTQKGSPDAIAQDFLSRGTNAVLNITRMEELDRQIIVSADRYLGELGIVDSHIVYWSPMMVQLLGEIPSCLSSIKQMQNLLLPLVHRIYANGAAPPNSMADAVKKLHAYGIPASVQKATLAYWTKHGKKVKDYRDVDQHITSLATHSGIRLQPTKKTIVLLPDNPQEKSPKRFTYAQRIDGIIFCKDALLSFAQFADAAFAELGLQPKPLSLAVNLESMGEGRPGTDRILGVMEGAEQVLIIRHLPDGRAAIGVLNLGASLSDS